MCETAYRHSHPLTKHCFQLCLLLYAIRPSSNIVMNRGQSRGFSAYTMITRFQNSPGGNLHNIGDLAPHWVTLSAKEQTADGRNEMKKVIQTH